MTDLPEAHGWRATADERALWFVDPARFLDMDAWHTRVAELRRDDPLLAVELDGFQPFWALTRHEDVFAVSRDNHRWLNTSRSVLSPDAAEDSQIRGVTIPAGGRVLLSYPSANRDGGVFGDPMRFDIKRPDADRLLSFGVGGHFCLGAQMARREIRTLMGKLAQQLNTIEPTGDAQWSEGHLVSGVKHLPVSYRFR